MSATWNAVDLLNRGDEGRTKPYINQYWAQTLGVIFGIGTGVVINFGTRRPSFSGIHKHAIGVLGWVSLLTYVQNKRDAYLAEKDAVLRHYVELHKEDFTIPERKKYADILEPWVPVR